MRRPVELAPWLFPLRILDGTQEVSFVELSRETFVMLAFHDAAHIGARIPIAKTMRFDEVVAFTERHLGGLFAPRYIFHHAFCSSTLLARDLARPGVGFGYREPAAMTE